MMLSRTVSHSLAILMIVVCCLSVLAAKPPASENDQDLVPEAVSLLGEPLRRPPLPAELQRSREEQLAEAERALEAAPNDEDRLIWVGRRLAYLGRYREAVEVFSEGLRRHSQSYKLRRHRGHRYITLRKFDAAVRDLTEAAKLIEGVPDAVEPDGLPNALDQPTGTMHTNIYYHLALAHYLKGEFAVAAQTWRFCLDAATNDDMRCAASYWRYLSLSRLGRTQEAGRMLEPIHDDMPIIENHAYHRLILLFKGAVQPDALTADADHLGPGVGDATVVYGLAMWHELRGEYEEACRHRRSLLHTDAWPAFGAIAAEADIARGDCAELAGSVN